MASNSKPRVHVYRQDVNRPQMVSVPFVKVTPEMANAIRRRDCTTGVGYWNHMAADGIVHRPIRRMTVEEAFPRLHMNGHNEKVKKSPQKTQTNGHVSKSQPDSYRGFPVEPKKAVATDLGTLQYRCSRDITSDPSRNYQIYNAKVRYVDNEHIGSNLATRPDVRTKVSKRKESKMDSFSKQNGHAIRQAIQHINATHNGKVHPSSQSNPQTNDQVGLPTYRVVSQTKDDTLHQDKPDSRTVWSEMTHLGVNGSMNHTFKIPRPKAMMSDRNSVVHRNTNLTASKKRAVSFGQDEVYEYTPLEPLNSYPIHEELL